MNPCVWPLGSGAMGNELPSSGATPPSSPVSPSSLPPTISHDFVALSLTYTGSPNVELGGINATWTVPPAPSANDNQTLFFFPGLQGGVAPISIIQPVLGWRFSDFPSAQGHRQLEFAV